MPKIPIYESGIGIGNANAGGAASYQGAGAFVGAGAAARPQGWQQLADGLQKLGNEIHRENIYQRQQELELDLLASMQEERKSASAFADEYMQTHKGASARDAEAAWQQYYTPRMEALRGQYGHNPVALKHIEAQGGNLNLGMLEGMRSYAQKEGEAYKDSVYQGELEGAKNALEDWRIPWAEKSSIMQELTRKTMAFYGDKGRDATAGMEKLKAFDKECREKMVEGGMAALIQQDPAKAYALLEQRPGALAAAFESGAAGSSAVGYDKNGGTSYGKYQIASAPGTMDAFMGWLDKNGHAEAATALRGAGPANTESNEGAMPAAWKQLVQAGKITDDMQEQFIEDSHVAPVVAAQGADFQQAMAGDARLAAAVHSTAVQHGSRNGTKLVQQAWERCGGNVDGCLDALYAARAGQFGSSDKPTQQAVAIRLQNERALLNEFLEPQKRAAYMGQAKKAMDKQQVDGAFAAVVDLPPNAALETLTSQAGQQRLGLTPAQADTALGLYKTHMENLRTLERGQREEHEKNTMTTAVNMALGANGEAANPTAAYSLIKDDPLLDGKTKLEALKALENGTMGKKDDPAFLSHLMTRMATGEPVDDSEIFTGVAAGKLTFETKNKLLTFKEDVAGPQGVLVKNAFKALDAAYAKSMMAEGTPEQAAAHYAAQTELVYAIEEAKKKGNVLDVLDPASNNFILPGIMVRNQLSMQDQITAMRNKIASGTPEAGAATTAAGASPARKPGETPAQYLQRMKGNN